MFTLPISANSDWNLPWLQLKALFVFPTFSLCSFQGAFLRLRAFGIKLFSPSRLRAPGQLSSLAPSPLRFRSASFSLGPSLTPKSLQVYLSIFSPILQNDTVFHWCQKHQIFGSSEPLTAPALRLAASLWYLYHSFLTLFRLLAFAFRLLRARPRMRVMRLRITHFSLERR